MTKLVAKFRIAVGVLALLVLATAALPAAAQQPTSVDPQASAVKEDQLFQEPTGSPAAAPCPIRRLVRSSSLPAVIGAISTG